MAEQRYPAVLAVVSSGGALTVDLSAVEYLDCAVINALFARADQLHLIAHRLLMSALTMSGLAELVTIEPALPAAEEH